MDKNTINAFRKDFAEAVKALETKYQVAIAIPSISYNEISLSAKMTVTSTSATGEKLVDHQALAQKNAKAGLALFFVSLSKNQKVPDVIIGKDCVLTNGQLGKIVDFDSKKHKYPFIVKCADGKTYKVPATHIKSIS